MRFLMLAIPEGFEQLNADFVPAAEGMAAMTRYNESLREAGVLLSVEGLRPAAGGARVRLRGGEAQVSRGPFPATRETVAGYWMIQVGSQDEAIAWASRCPMPDNAVIEIRQVFETEDFPEEVRKPADR
jgi:hypothetical protein